MQHGETVGHFLPPSTLFARERKCRYRRTQLTLDEWIMQYASDELRQPLSSAIVDYTYKFSSSRELRIRSPSLSSDVNKITFNNFSNFLIYNVRVAATSRRYFYFSYFFSAVWFMRLSCAGSARRSARNGKRLSRKSWKPSRSTAEICRSYSRSSIGRC